MLSELVAQMRAALEGVTSGPWFREDTTPGSTHIVDGDRWILALIPWHRPKGNAHRNAAHIALCSPENIRVILDALSSAEAERQYLGKLHAEEWQTQVARAEAAESALTTERAKTAKLREAATKTRALVSEAAQTGFNYKDGDWADRLYANQGSLSRALSEAQEQK